MRNPGRNCTVCMGQGKGIEPAVYVATSASGMQWYECAKHSATDNLADEERTSVQDIDDWFAQIPPLDA